MACSNQNSSLLNSNTFVAPPPKASVVVALSGGVDSSVAAALAVSKGYNVTAITLQLVDCANATGVKVCCGAEAIGAARKVCRHLGIEHKVIDCRKEFSELILKYSLEEYAKGRTPNPCVMCNALIKFGLLFDKAAQFGAKYIATGHHTQVTTKLAISESLPEAAAAFWNTASSDFPILLKGHDLKKDQSYFLHRLNKKQLLASWFPIGGYNKEEVRKLARQYSLPTAERIESTDACFQEEGYTFAQSLSRQFDFPLKTGEILDDSGKFLGKHKGIHNYTIGQRRNLGVNTGYRLWVKEIRSSTNEVILTANEDALLANDIIIQDPFWTGQDSLFNPPDSFHALAKIRYLHKPALASVKKLENNRLAITFEEQQRAITSGQSVVFYLDNLTLGGGWIV